MAVLVSMVPAPLGQVLLGRLRSARLRVYATWMQSDFEGRPMKDISPPPAAADRIRTALPGCELIVDQEDQQIGFRWPGPPVRQRSWVMSEGDEVVASWNYLADSAEKLRIELRLK
jgi:hypothetical protein